MSMPLPLTAVMNAAALTLALASSVTQAQEAPAAPAQAASAPSAAAPEEAKSKCSLSWQTVAGAILGSAADKVASNSGSKAGVDGLGKPSGDAVQGAIAPGCVRPATPSVLQRK